MILLASLQAAQALLCQAFCLPYTHRVYAPAHMAPGVESIVQAAAMHVHTACTCSPITLCYNRQPEQESMQL